MTKTTGGRMISYYTGINDKNLRRHNDRDHRRQNDSDDKMQDDWETTGRRMRQRRDDRDHKR